MNNIKLPTTVIGKRIELKGLSVFPLYLKSGLKAVVRSGLEMIDKGVVHVKEVSDAGSVPTLYVTNDCLHNVLFVEGDQLVGAKQNRMCNSSVLIAPIPLLRFQYPVWNRVVGTKNQKHFPRQVIQQRQICVKSSSRVSEMLEKLLCYYSNRLILPRKQQEWYKNRQLYTMRRRGLFGEKWKTCSLFTRPQAQQVLWKTCLRQSVA